MMLSSIADFGTMNGGNGAVSVPPPRPNGPPPRRAAAASTAGRGGGQGAGGRRGSRRAEASRAGLGLSGCKAGGTRLSRPFAPLTLPQNTQNGLRPSRNAQKYWGCRGMEAGGLGVLCLLCAAKRLQCVQWRKKSRRFCNDLMIPIQLCAPLRVTVAILFRCRRIGLRTREHQPSSPTTSRARCAYRRGQSRSSHGRPRPFQRDRTPPQCPRPR